MLSSLAKQFLAGKAAPISAFDRLYGEVDLLDLKQATNARHKIVVFNHIPKTAGSTIRQILRNQPDALFTPVDTLQQRHAAEELLARGQFDQPATHILSGHEAAGLRRHLPKGIPIFQFAFVREPISHFESFLSYDALRWRESDLTPADYMARRPSNPQLRSLEADNVDIAADIIKSQYIFVGMTGEFSRDFRILSHLIGLSPTVVRSRNVLRTEDRRHLPAELRERFLKCNSGDLQLYELVKDANRTFAERFSAAFPNVPDVRLDCAQTVFAEPTPINMNLDLNNDYISLYLTGASIFPQDPAHGMAFFDKAVSINVRVARRAYSFLAAHNSRLARCWLSDTRQRFAELGHTESLKVIDSI